MLERTLIEDAMRRALLIARRGPADDPNPQVGSVILAPDGRIVAEGWHRGSGSPHAEVDALAQLPEHWRGRTAELTAVVTLEPCNHTGRTGPCARALIEAGVGAVAFALADPGAESSGGADTLRAAGVEVLGGVLPGEARALLGPWLARQAGASGSQPSAGSQPAPSRTAASAPQPRPRVTVKWAQSLDGRAAAADGSSRWITGPEARADVHRRRAEADAILVGTGPLIADDPALTARDARGGLLVPAADQPLPVILGHRPIPAGSRVLSHPALAARGLDRPLRAGGDDLASDLAALHADGIRSLFVEGGPAVASAIIAAGLADELLVYLAPALLGGPRLALGDLGIAGMDAILRLRVSQRSMLGADQLIIATVTPAQAAAPEED
ncbi:bifunctional diaminohydroxyphosphoribosylaminopyrimidine deaminase/5-amino-6-(5-phosphoribosylamino)uracil reductase RibD [Leucobacter massiliensis]|uniref:Riboflavin biosynthesis protein RibD n=1 Tax=Leucobacter massiliensis TaxID=1686285 RepID=A0A2S9QS96_9MICO|nr:dihydrofolate reductase family protein [Leucobacter massiliensis]PRI12463.1 riboflavin biosynthesis protein RibD [Leucobacter massiliensis]